MVEKHNFGIFRFSAVFVMNRYVNLITADHYSKLAKVIEMKRPCLNVKQKLNIEVFDLVYYERTISSAIDTCLFLKELGLDKDIRFPMILGAVKSPMIKQSSFKHEQEFTIWRMGLSSVGT